MLRGAPHILSMEEGRMHFRCSYAEEMTFPHRAVVAFSHCSHLFPSGLEMLLSQGNWLEPFQSFLMSEKFKSPSRDRTGCLNVPRRQRRFTSDSFVSMLFSPERVPSRSCDWLQLAVAAPQAWLRTWLSEPWQKPRGQKLVGFVTIWLLYRFHYKESFFSVFPSLCEQVASRDDLICCQNYL